MFRRISVTEDHTIEERQEIRRLVDESKEKNRNETNGLESERRSKKRLALGEVHQAGTSVKRINIFSNVNNVSKVSKRQQNTNEDDLNIVAEKSFNLVKKILPTCFEHGALILLI